MRRIHVSTDALARRLKAGVLLMLAGGLLGIAAQSSIHPEQHARPQSIAFETITR